MTMLSDVTPAALGSMYSFVAMRSICLLRTELDYRNAGTNPAGPTLRRAKSAIWRRR
jgi:hypothetical protein